MAASGNLTPSQSRAIAELLEPGATIQAAAASAHIGERTLRRWLERDDFRRAHREAASRIFDLAIARLRVMANRAVQTLGEALNGDATATQVRAALGVIDFAAKVDLDDLIERVEMLERRDREAQP